MKPQEIENESFRIIDSEAGAHGFPADQWPVVRRMIHTSADFEWQLMTQLHPDAIRIGVAAIRRGCPIVTDTNMARVGIRQRDLDRFGGVVHCYMTDARVAETAVREGITRAKAAVDVATSEIEGGIYVIGNAPTALLRLIELMDRGQARPELVVGLPVGFVNAAESKALLMERDVPHITNVGRKGGSNVAAAVINALIIMAGQDKP
ncbi:precorrin-8X methylmutase [Desulfosarcina ovata subsp. sediminis]|uniref:Precorrin-8X methylmutase n=1 Tax=Desulfosarcina ovata subsp. sediminis TaxID=885957 RepID=A0A5K7ZPH5_9BACT|nr:precorrin-8X methylmutase [Desulfosarcina ovata]BBO82507.1 precorrin-8X methylmutase [Desulfosarcina ovata subsp. sediminis]